MLGIVGIVAFGAVVYSGLAGVQDAFGNLAPTVIYVIFWVGLVVASALFGERLQAAQPVARDRQGHLLDLPQGLETRAPARARVPDLARSLAGGHRHPRLRLRRACLPQPRRPLAARDHGAHLRRGDARRHGLVRRSTPGASGPIRSASTSASSHGCRCSRVATASSSGARCCPAPRRSSSGRARSPCSLWRSAPPPSTARRTAPSGSRSRPTSSRSSAISALGSREPAAVGLARRAWSRASDHRRLLPAGDPGHGGRGRAVTRPPSWPSASRTP